MLYATGLEPEDMNKPQIGVSSVWWEGNPCNKHLMDLAGRVKEGVQAEDMVGYRFNTIGVSDGISMGTPGMSFSLQSRDLIATEPSVAMLPYKVWRWPVFLIGLSRGMITSWPSLRSGQDARFSAIVLPVHVMQLPSMRPSFMRNCAFEREERMEPVSDRVRPSKRKRKSSSRKLSRAPVRHGRIRTVKRIYRHRPRAAEGESMSFITFFR